MKIPDTGIHVKGKLSTIKQFYVNLFGNKLWHKVHRGIVVDLKVLLNRFQSELGISEANVLENHMEKAEG